ncbi:hypothetical protein LguiA_009404 [Lonicera macranthoides]
MGRRLKVAYDPLDSTGRIVIKWDVISLNPDGYVAMVMMNNFQMYRHIMSPGWTLGWMWAKKEVVWSVVGAQPTDQRDCSEFPQNVPQCCKKNPTIIDLLPRVPYRKQVANCCKGGLLASSRQDPAAAVSAFQVSVGLSGRAIQKNMTWEVTCTYSQLVASTKPTSCVSMSYFYSDKIIPCPSCACGCSNEKDCVGDESNIPNVVGTDMQKKTEAYDIGMFYGTKKFYNDDLMEAGPDGYVRKS